MANLGVPVGNTWVYREHRFRGMGHIATRRQFTWNLFSGWLSLAVEVVVAFVLTPYIIVKLGAAVYGVWSLMISVIGYLGLIDIGIRGSVGRYINHYLALKDRAALNEVVGTSTLLLSGLSLMAGLAALVVADNFTTIFPKTPVQLVDDIRYALPLLVIGLWLSFMSSILANLLAAKEALYLTNGYGLLTLLFRSLAIYAVLDAGQGIRAMVLVTLATSLLGLILSLWSVRRVYGSEMPRFLLFSTDRLKEMWRFGVASFVARTSSTVANDSAPIIGMWILGPEAVAIYSVALTLTQNARRVLDQAGAAIYSSVMRAGAVRDMAGLRTLYVRFMDVSFAIGSLVFIGLMVFSASFLRLWVGPEYVEGAWVVGILALGYLMSAIASIAPLALASLDRVGTTMRISMAEALACVALTALLPGALGLGLIGMALGSCLPRLVSCCLVYPWLAERTLGAQLWSPMWRGIGRNLLFCTILALIFLAISGFLPGQAGWSWFAVSVSLATAVHLLLAAAVYESLPVVGGITDRLRRMLPRLTRR